MSGSEDEFDRLASSAPPREKPGRRAATKVRNVYFMNYLHFSLTVFFLLS